MAGSVNKVILIGRLGKDPEVRYTQGGQPLAKFSLATSESWGQGAERQERTEWHNIVVWGKLAEICGQYLTKGRQVYIEGRIQTRKYQDQSGQDRWITDINAREVVFIGDKPQGGSGRSEPPPGADYGPPPGGGGGYEAGGYDDGGPQGVSYDSGDPYAGQGGGREAPKGGYGPPASGGQSTGARGRPPAGGAPRSAPRPVKAEPEYPGYEGPDKGPDGDDIPF